MSVSSRPQQVSAGKLRAPAPEPVPSYTTAGKTVWLTLDEPDHMNAAHAAGDVLRGAAHLRLKAEAAVTELTIHFRCKVSTELTERTGSSTTTYTWKGLLFSYTIQPIDRPEGARLAGDHAFPFTFAIPAAAPPNAAHRIFAASPGWDVSDGAPLPPTFHLQYFSHVERVTYYLEVRATRKGLFRRNLRDKLPIRLSPVRTHLAPAPQMCMREHAFWAPAAAAPPPPEDPERPRGLVRKLFRSASQGAQASFALRAWVPAAVWPGGPVPLQLELSHGGAVAAADLPAVRLCALHVRLTATTVFRVPIRDRRRPAGRVRKADEKVDIVNVALPARPALPPTGEVLDLARFVGGLVLPDVKPSFRSCAISRWYAIKATVELDVAGKRSTYEMGKHACVVYPGLHRPAQPGAEVADQLMVAGPDESRGPTEALPAYEPPPDYLPSPVAAEGRGEEGRESA